MEDGILPVALAGSGAAAILVRRRPLFAIAVLTVGVTIAAFFAKRAITSLIDFFKVHPTCNWPRDDPGW